MCKHPTNLPSVWVFYLMFRNLNNLRLFSSQFNFCFLDIYLELHSIYLRLLEMLGEHVFFFYCPGGWYSPGSAFVKIMWLWAYSSLVCSVFLGISPVMNPPELLSFVEIPTCAMELAALNKTKKTAKSLQHSLSVIFKFNFFFHCQKLWSQIQVYSSAFSLLGLQEIVQFESQFPICQMEIRNVFLER